MVFSSVVFIFYFLPITLVLYFLAEKTQIMWVKNTVVLIASLVFYSWGGLQYLLLLLCLVLINYVSGLLIQNTNHKRLFLSIGLAVDLLSLIYYKYLNFLLSNLVNLIHSMGNTEYMLDMKPITLPIGISFFTFQIMSYLIDVYRGEVRAQRNPAWLTLYIMMFPQLSAGPIVRYSDICKEIEHRSTSLTMAEQGVKRFICGFSKKIFIANCMGNVADAVFNITGQTSTILAWAGAICYAFQIFFDFSAYSDMAIGLGLLFGFRFNENFNHPYISKSIQEFWRRWHISLSTWFRDYLYIPLGGNRKGQKRTYLNLAIVFFCTGIWHGAAWQFIVWGMFHGCLQLLERAWLGKWLKRIPAIFSWLYTMFMVVIGWVFFRANDLSSAIKYLKNMFTYHALDISSANINILLKFTPLFFLVAAFAVLLSTPVAQMVEEKISGYNKYIVNIGYLLLMFITIVYLSGLSYNPFIYFQF